MNPIEPVRKTITVRASAERAFRVFTAEYDTWWPRSHHLGKTPLLKAIIEERAGGRCYSQHEDGTECDWGKVMVWDPPKRFVFAWLITPVWQPEPDLSKASEVEVRFIPEAGGRTRVELEHRHFERHGEGADIMRDKVDTKGGWGDLLSLFASQTES